MIYKEDILAYIGSLEPQDLSDKSFLAHKRVFVIKEITKLDIIHDIKSFMLKAESKNQSFSTFKKALMPYLAKKGYAGIKPYRIQLIYDTLLRDALSSSLAQKIYSMEGDVYLQYSAILDSRTRPKHRAAHKLIKHRDDPFWIKNFPPNGFNCRCRVRALRGEDLSEKQKESIAKSKPKDAYDEGFGVDKRDLDNYLKNIIQIKLENITYNKSEKEALKGLGEWIELQNQKYKETLEIYQEAKEGKITDKAAKNKRRITVAKSSKTLQESLKTEAKEVILSYATLESHVHKHKEVNAFDYYLIQHMIEYPKKEEKGNKDNHIIYYKKLGFYYKAVFKRAVSEEGEDEIFLQTLMKGSREYPK